MDKLYGEGMGYRRGRLKEIAPIITMLSGQ